ncbi:MAG: T9SS type A sorting domain-containing protein, partial [Haliscomenobacter sp.]|uniref:T9SS type A sorting domain-containing protein n=1 Tax=Haliscomenobacter sp. TaxID=2717303 RepID=UPI0029B67108
GDEEFYLSKNLVPNEKLSSDKKSGDYHLVADLDRNGNDDGTGYNSTLLPGPNNYAPYCQGEDIPKEYYHSFMYTQIIKVYDSERPVVTGIRDTFCTSPSACTANITKMVTIKDNCTNKVELERQQLMIAPFQTLDAGKMITYSTPSWSSKDLGNGQYEITVSNLPEGTHDLIVVGRDECGNLSVPTRIPFVVKDCKAPAPICINGLSTELMPDGNNGGMMAVWASDFVASKIYDCNGQGPEIKDGLKLVTKYSLNRVGEPVIATQTGLNLSCADAGKVILVELHAWDELGNHDFCVTFVEVQDNRKVCPDPGNVVTGEISGLVATDEAEPVLGVKIDVSGDAQMNQSTTSNGLFNFPKLPAGSDFTLTAQLDKDHLNGVSTFDLVQLQKHILGVQTIANPYRLIAADVNNSKSISTLDMIQIRKLILNIDERFSNVPSWRFVDAAYKFPDPSNPWVEAFPEVVNVNDLAGKVQANFIAIKMGDINGNAQVSSTTNVEVRSTKVLQLQTEEQELKAGQHYAVSISAKDLASVQGFQFTLQVEPSVAQLENIEYNGVMKADHFGYFPRSGEITSSYVGAPLGAPLSSTTAESLLFTLHLKAEADLPLSKVLKINSQLTPKEAYGKDDELMDVHLELKGAQLELAALHQNTPNPFVEETTVGFYLPKASAATLIVRDVKGALLYRLEGNYAKGENQITLKHGQLRSSGVLYYTLETADFTATKKMILLNK